jgi:hypothetical protein
MLIPTVVLTYTIAKNPFLIPSSLKKCSYIQIADKSFEDLAHPYRGREEGYF